MYKGIKCPLPEFLDVDSSHYVSTKVYTDGRLYIYNKELAYVKARLDMYKQSSTEAISFIAWTEMDASKFLEFSENPNAQRGLIYASLYSDIPLYSKTKGLEVLLDFKRRDENFDPSIIILKSSNNDELLNDFMNGIEPSRFSLWLNRIN